MAIEFQDVRSIIKSLKYKPNLRFENLLILGNSRIYPTYSQIKKYANEIGFEIQPHHQEQLNAIEFGQILGFRNSFTLDINGEATITLDLTQEIKAEYIDRFDCIIDAGVLFYCFDPGTVLRNLHRMLKKDGLMAHITAVSGFYGRAYYNVHPLVLNDFYSANGYVLLNTNFRSRPSGSRYYNLLFALIKKLFFNEIDTMKDIEADNLLGEKVYLARSSRWYFIFSQSYNKNEPGMIPNNVVGTLVYYKTVDSAPVNPILTFL